MGGSKIFRDSSAVVMACFASYYGITSCLHAELQAAMSAIVLAFAKGWLNLWLECDSILVVLDFSSPEKVP